MTGGTARPSPADALRPGDDVIRYHRGLWPLVLLATAALFVLDVYLRRVRFLGYRTMQF